jgi:probable phosphoglycerate mutase
MFADHLPAKEILLVRHGESREQSGQTSDGVDPDLSRLGERQARLLRARLAGERFDAVYVSPLRRAWRTFELTGIEHRHARYDSRIIEVEWVCGFYRDHIGRPPPLARPDKHAAWAMPASERLAAFLVDVCAGPERRVLVVGHQGLFRRLREAFLGFSTDAEPRGFSLDNASISTLTIDGDGRRRVRAWNDNRHVARLLRPLA